MDLEKGNINEGVLMNKLSKTNEMETVIANVVKKQFKMTVLSLNLVSIGCFTIIILRNDKKQCPEGENKANSKDIMKARKQKGPLVQLDSCSIKVSP